MAYLTFEEYTAMGGKEIEVSVFRGYEFFAESTVDYYTYNRLQNLVLDEQPARTIRAVKEVMFDLIKLLMAQDEYQGLDVAGGVNTDAAQIIHQENDGVQVSYNILTAHQAADTIKQRILDLVKRCFSGCMTSTGKYLLYKGIYPDE